LVNDSEWQDAQNVVDVDEKLAAPMRLVVKKLLMIILTVVVHTMKDIIFNVRLRLL
jgi:hypothetical protein